MTMLVVVPIEERAAERSSIDEVGEGRWKLWLIFGGLEQRFDVRIIVGNVRSGMGLGYTQIGKHECDGFRFHGAATIGMYRQLFGIGTLLSNRRPQQNFRQLGTLPICNHPANHVSAINIDYCIEIKISPFLRSV